MIGTIAALCSLTALAEDVTVLSVGTDGATETVTIRRADSGQSPKIFTLGGEKARIVMDWAEADYRIEGRKSESGRTDLNGHAVKTVRHARKGKDGMRVVLDLVPGADYLGADVTDTHIKVRVKHKPASKAAIIPAVARTPISAPKPVSAKPRYFRGGVPYPRLAPKGVPGKAVTPTGKKVIVIDPGHGGRDPGAIGVKKGTHEKVIVLKAALELKKQLEAKGRYTVVLTRGDDTYVDHDDRIKKARIRNADLFISIHADSTKSTKARGASVYTLADRAKGRSKRIVNSQNWIMDVDLGEQSDPVGDILVDLAQRKTLSQSTMFADVLIKNLSGSTRLIGNSHRRAGYYVLLAPDVPAVLLELGFLSNADDEKLLRSVAHRKKLMRSVSTAIDSYFTAQNP